MKALRISYLGAASTNGCWKGAGQQVCPLGEISEVHALHSFPEVPTELEPLPATTPAQKCTVFLLLFPMPSASSEGHLKSLSVLLSSKTFCGSYHLEGIFQIPCPSPSFPFSQPNPSILQTHLELSLGKLLPSSLLHPLSSLPVYISVELSRLIQIPPPSGSLP